MKSFALRKAVSIACVLALLLSVCVVSFAGTAGAEVSIKLNNCGTVTSQNLSVGDAIPNPTSPVGGVQFLGWYDKTLTTRYTNVTSGVTTYYAKYSSAMFTFNDGRSSAFDPNNILSGGSNWAKQCNIMEESAGNYAMGLNHKSTNQAYFGIVPANYDGTGFKLKPSTKYEISFKYKTTKFVDDSVIGVRLYRTNASGICQSGGKSLVGSAFLYIKEATPEWTGFSVMISTPAFTGDQDYFNFNYGIDKGEVTAYFDDLCITEVSDTPTSYTFNNKGEITNATLKPGDALPTIAHPAFLGWFDETLTTMFAKAPATTTKLFAKYDPNYVPPVGKNMVMDFEDNFEWSTEAANTYTYKSGNYYVNRGELLEKGDNHFFRVSHFMNMNGYYYFVVDDGTDLYEINNAGIYTVEFDYRVEHSETETAIGILYANPANGKKTKAKEFAAFVYRDDAEDEWTHISYTFMADINADRSQNRLGLYVFNETRCPEEFASKIDFDNIKITAVSITGEDAVLDFDTIGGEDIPTAVVPANAPIGSGILTTPTKYGYAFNGWKYDVTTGDVTVAKEVTETTSLPAGLIRVYADWILDPNAVELTFRCNVKEFDDNTLPIVALKGGKISDVPVAPEVEGQHFEGWFLDRAFKKPLDPECAPTESTMVFAKWKSDGILVDYEEFTLATGSYTGHVSDRYNRIEEPGNTSNHVLEYDLSKGGNQSASSAARAQFHTGKAYIDAVPGLNYVVKFKYNVVKFNSAGTISVMLTSRNNTWGVYKQQANALTYSNKTDGWVEGVIEFTAVPGDSAGPNDYTMCFAMSGDAVVYLDDVVIITPENEMNFYGTAIRLNTNGGEKLDTISGYVGEEIVLPTPKRSGYMFKGWYLDTAFEKPFTQKYYTEETFTLTAKWQLGKFSESFEEFPQSVKSLGVAGAYVFYNKSSKDFDASNVHSGGTSLFRNGATAGNKAFTIERNADLALTVGEEYTLDLYIKPVSVTDTAATINLLGLGTFTGINSGVSKGVIANVSDLKVGEWNHVTYTFKAQNQYVAISTGANNDMYFDDITVTLKGYTGASTGDSTVSPMIILMIVVLSAGALLITGKKVYAK